jgi:hypothetical protein
MKQQLVYQFTSFVGNVLLTFFDNNYNSSLTSYPSSRERLTCNVFPDQATQMVHSIQQKSNGWVIWVL